MGNGSREDVGKLPDMKELAKSNRSKCKTARVLKTAVPKSKVPLKDTLHIDRKKQSAVFVPATETFFRTFLPVNTS